MIEQVNIDNIRIHCAAVGYQLDDSEIPLLTLIWEGVENEIIHACNISKIPACDYAEIERVVAYRLMLTKLRSGGLNGVQVDGIVKKITEGDTTVEFSAGNSSATDSLASYFKSQTSISRKLIASHRKLVW